MTTLVAHEAIADFRDASGFLIAAEEADFPKPLGDLLLGLTHDEKALEAALEFWSRPDLDDIAYVRKRIDTIVRHVPETGHASWCQKILAWTARSTMYAVMMAASRK